MKRVIYIASLIAVSAFYSCDKVEQAYQQNFSTDLDTTLYPGNWSDYSFPTFTQNTNTNRNMLIEDFTGHKCTFCPAAADLAHQLKQNNPGRVFVASIHSGPLGMGDFQTTETDYPEDFTNPEGLEIGTYFGTNDGGFSGNPRGPVSRITLNGNIFQSPGAWTNMVNDGLAQNDLKVNLQSVANYYEQTRGLYLHTEIDVLDASLDPTNLAQVVYFIQDSLVGDQKMGDNSHNPSYIHRDIMRGCIDDRAFGRTLSSGDINVTTGNYQLDYSYKIPDEYNVANTHLLIYVFDKSTMEIYQVIEQEIE